MKIGVVPAALIAKAARLDAEFYVGDPLAAPIAKTRKRLAHARKRLARLIKEQIAQDAERERLGIKVQPEDVGTTEEEGVQ